MRWRGWIGGLAVLFCGAVLASSDPAKNIDALLAKEASRDRPGLAVGVYRQGKVVYSRAFGMADLEQDRALTPASQFNVASVSKHFTAFAVLLLVQGGKLGLDDDIRRYLPYVPDFGAKISVRHLIWHTSGLREEGNLFIMAGRAKEDYRRQQQVLNLVEAQRALNFAPGSDHLYCNTNYILLAELVKAVSGQSFREFTSERIFKPLGMTRSFFRDDMHELVPGKANSYKQDAAKGRWLLSLDNHDLLGSIDLFTTAEDLLLWAKNLAHPVVGSPELIKQFVQMGAIDDGTPLEYGYGLTPMSYAGHAGVAHGGSQAEFRSDFNFFPAEDFAVVVLRNSVGEMASIVDAIVREYLGDAGGKPLVPPRAPISVSKRNALVGDYLTEFGPLLSLRVEGDGITSRAGASPERLVTRADGTFDTGDDLRAFNNYYQPVWDRGGRVTEIRGLSGSGRREVTYRRVTVALPSVNDLQELSGSYRSSELDTTYRLAVRDGALTISSLWLTEPVVLRPTVRDQFESSAWWLRSLVFQRDSAGKPTGFVIHAGRVRNVQFQLAP
ncbi:serine hydrolase domain-containing protein [Steroidobacter sp.]|uniref:serine hydrolase domain-containing protein n=1 Tax=Steroidobacter sp. TaxID=1978227 RepID=UPI001A4C9B9A|nr:serine hydrolase domain-containing protein [Steroidobacter sp.]MBL8271981.1 beta-lactamase family protein [Steroidobacter sp.]